MKKSKEALYRKAVKKELIRRLGRIAGLFRYHRHRDCEIYYSVLSNRSARQCANMLVDWHRSDLMHERRLFKEWLNQEINSPGGELDVSRGILRELAILQSMSWQGRTTYQPGPLIIDPDAAVAY